MANPEHLKILRWGAFKWNPWRKDNPEVIPDLSGAILNNGDFRRINFSGVNLIRANLIEASLEEADLSSANLSNASLDRANFSNANLSRADLTGNYSQVYGHN